MSLRQIAPGANRQYRTTVMVPATVVVKVADHAVVYAESDRILIEHKGLHPDSSLARHGEMTWLLSIEDAARIGLCTITHL